MYGLFRSLSFIQVPRLEYGPMSLPDPGIPCDYIDEWLEWEVDHWWLFGKANKSSWYKDRIVEMDYTRYIYIYAYTCIYISYLSIIDPIFLWFVILPISRMGHAFVYPVKPPQALSWVLHVHISSVELCSYATLHVEASALIRKKPDYTVRKSTEYTISFWMIVNINIWYVHYVIM